MSGVDGVSSTGSKHKRKVVGVVLLGGQELIVHVDVKGRFYEVFNQVTAHLSLRETEYFGLALLKDAEYQFLVLDEKISKIAPKKWKTSQGEGWDSDGSTPLFTVWFRVQFYVDQVVLLREKVTRHLYYLQLRENVLKYDHLYNEEKCFQIVGFALQADYGNFIADKHTDGYFDPRHYFPAWMVEKRGVAYLASNCPVVHADLHNLTRSDAQLRYVRECSSAPGAHNLHFYRARKKKTDKACSVWLAICYSGIEVYEDDAGFKNLISRFLWQDIGRIVFDKKKFEIRSAESAGGRRFAYYTENDGTAKYLLNLCRSTHQFQMAIQPKLMEIRHLEAEDKKRYKESYIYSDARDLHANGGPVRHRSGRSPGKSVVNTQRYSAVSDASSNTTSGIVSDRMALSFDESEEAGREIIIDCPPKQRSFQRAAAHPRMPLRDSYKMTPPTPSGCSPALPPQSLELFPSPRSSSSKGSPASPHLPPELSPASSTGSYRTKLPGTYPGKGLALPLTPSPTSPGKAYPITNRSPSSPREWDSPSVGPKPVCCHDSFKGLPGATGTVSAERRNVSVDSTTTSGSTASTGTVALSVENSPVAASVTRGQTPGRSPSFSYAAVRMAQVVPTSVLAGGLIHSAEQSASGCLMYPPGALPRLEVSDASPLHHFAAPKTMNPVGGHIYTDAAYADANIYTDTAYTDTNLYMDTPFADTNNLYRDTVYADTNMYMDTAYADSKMHTDTAYTDGACFKMEEVLPPEQTDMVKTEEKAGGGGGGVVTAVGGMLCGHPPPAQYMMGVGAPGVCSHTHVVSKGGSLDSGVQASVDGSSGSQHSAQSSEEDPAKNSGSHSEENGAAGGKGAIPKRNTPARVKAGSRVKPTHVSVKNQKEALHPDIEQILGQQSQAHSLPFIMALCNDLMTGSSHSSTGSYDTSTRRSSDTDSRRWSTCGTVETATVADPSSGLERYMASAGPAARPYSWHSEHFDLDTSLRPVPLLRGAACMSPPIQQPQSVTETHRSFPQELCLASNTGHSAVWAQSIAYSNRFGGVCAAGGSASRGGEGLNRYSPELIAQLMIPSRLSSGGHSVSDGGNIGPHKTLKENIGVA